MSFFDTHTKAEMIADVLNERGVQQPCGDCWWRQVHAPPNRPFQRCQRGHLLKWLDERRDPELGLRDCDDDGSED